MNAKALVSEALRAARAAKVSSLLVALVLAATCFITLATVGKTAAHQASLLQRFDSAGAREISVINTGAQPLGSTTNLAAINNLAHVRRAVQLRWIGDVHSMAVGGTEPASLAEMRGEFSELVTLQQGRWPRHGEAIIGSEAQARLRFDQPSGAVQSGVGEQLPVVGSFHATAPFTVLNSAVITPAAAEANLSELRLEVDQMTQVNATLEAVTAILAPIDRQSVRIESGRSIVDEAFALHQFNAEQARSLLLLILTAGAAFVAMVVFADVLVRRNDLGRRRALGATRATLIMLVVVRNVIAGSLGALLGSLGGVVFTTLSGARPPWPFVLAVAILALLAALIASIPPAIYAATRDPVRVLRTP